MKRIIGNAFDIMLILSVLVFFYFRAFGHYGHGRLDPTTERYIELRGILTILAIFILPFRIKRYPKISHFLVYSRDGAPRKNVGALAIALAAFVLISISFARLVVLFLSSKGI